MCTHTHICIYIYSLECLLRMVRHEGIRLLVVPTRKLLHSFREVSKHSYPARVPEMMTGRTEPGRSLNQRIPYTCMVRYFHVRQPVVPVVKTPSPGGECRGGSRLLFPMVVVGWQRVELSSSIERSLGAWVSACVGVDPSSELSLTAATCHQTETLQQCCWTSTHLPSLSLIESPRGSLLKSAYIEMMAGGFGTSSWLIEIFYLVLKPSAA